jgi:hypothetical protein
MTWVMSMGTAVPPILAASSRSGPACSGRSMRIICTPPEASTSAIAAPVTAAFMPLNDEFQSTGAGTRPGPTTDRLAGRDPQELAGPARAELFAQLVVKPSSAAGTVDRT